MNCVQHTDAGDARGQGRAHSHVRELRLGCRGIRKTDIRHFDQGLASGVDTLERTGSCRMGEGRQVNWNEKYGHWEMFWG